MTRQDLDRVFTEKITEYLTQGYIFSTATMGGSQGEIAKVDLIKDADFIRVYMTRETIGFKKIIKILEGKKEFSTDDISGTIWENELEILNEEEFLRLENRNGYFYLPVKQAKRKSERVRNIKVVKSTKTGEHTAMYREKRLRLK